MSERATAGRGPRNGSRTRLYRCGCLGLLLTALPWLPACNQKSAGSEPARGGPAPAVPVKVATAVQEDVPVQIRAIARVEAFQTVTVKPQLAGQMTAVHFTEGQDVKAGDLLFSLDDRPFKAAVQQAEANLAHDTALAEDAEREAAWEAALVKQNAAAQREYEKARAAADALQAAVRADQAAVEKTRLDLGYCSIQSPIDGRTGSRLTDLGNVVKADETLLVTINQTSPIYVTLSVPEQYLSGIKEYQAAGPLTVTAAIPESKDPAEQGVLSFVDNKVDNMTGMIMLKGTFRNEARRLWPGQYVHAVLTLTTRPGAVVVPSAAVQTGQSGQFIYVVKADRTVETHPVATGPSLDDEVVIERGIAAGETVVTDGQLRLVPGAKVEIKEGAASAPAAHP